MLGQRGKGALVGTGSSGLLEGRFLRVKPCGKTGLNNVGKTHVDGQNQGQLETSEVVLGDLINQTGKMRMLSHRAVMMMLLTQMGGADQSKALRHFDDAIVEFSNIFEWLVSSVAGANIAKEAAEFLKTSEVFGKEHRANLEYFLKQAQKICRTIGDNATIDIAELQCFANFVATDLLKTLNDIVAAIGRALSKIGDKRKTEADQKRQVIVSSIESMEKINQSIFMIGINTSIEAVRSGQQGAGTKVLADEIRKLGKSSSTSLEILREKFGA